MLFKKLTVLLLFLNGVLAACGCSSRNAAAPVALTLVRSGSQSLGESQSMEAVWISTRDQWARLMDRASGTAEILIQPPARPEIDFEKYGVLLIRMGQKPSGGYGLKLMADTAKVENRTALVPVRWIEPAEGTFTTQAITFPYLMIRMPKGAFDRIAVIDQDGAVRHSLDVNE